MKNEEPVSQGAVGSKSSGEGAAEVADTVGSGAVMSESNSVDQALLDSIPVSVSVELGRTKLKISELMGLNKGSVVPLDSAAGEPLQVFVNNTLIATGEIVLVDQHYGIKLTQIVPKADRFS
jgi:flagellar motor switch protein FliN/FliY